MSYSAENVILDPKFFPLFENIVFRYILVCSKVPVTPEVEEMCEERIAGWSETLVHIYEKYYEVKKMERSYLWWQKQIAQRILPANLPTKFRALLDVPDFPFPEYLSEEKKERHESLKWGFLMDVITSHCDNIQAALKALAAEEVNITSAAEKHLRRGEILELKIKCQKLAMFPF
ncbi:uncharacterized protein LOC129584967 [Paramacrobiotus metropolitanus]|uniref:uncharacterized protein LOC129584967 n=1 Tax=Paramacrobiotus metropolitanus TaxID=2943436 RepID=UPI002446512E|nr:uncharacterized protein LOC129584967 [Paramacrobiotus metropolitanus]